MYKILYKKDNSNNITKSEYQQFLPEDVIKHIDEINNQDRKCASIHTWLLLNKLCNEIYHRDLSMFTFTYNENGKPLFKEFFVSLAHTKGLICVGMADFPIGIDIEMIYPLKNKRIKRILCGNENLSDEEFFIRFTQQEASVKKAGTLLGYPKGVLNKQKDDVCSIILKLDNESFILSYTANEIKAEIRYKD